MRDQRKAAMTWCRPQTTGHTLLYTCPCPHTAIYVSSSWTAPPWCRPQTTGLTAGHTRTCPAGIRLRVYCYTPNALILVLRQHTSAFVSIRQHTSAYVSIRMSTADIQCPHTGTYVSAYCYVCVLYTSPATHLAPSYWCYVSIRQHTSAYVSIRMSTADI